MTQDVINTGTVANDGTGDSLRVSFTKTNNNFSELYNHHTNVTANIIATQIAANSWANQVGSSANALTAIVFDRANDALTVATSANLNAIGANAKAQGANTRADAAWVLANTVNNSLQTAFGAVNAANAAAAQAQVDANYANAAIATYTGDAAAVYNYANGIYNFTNTVYNYANTVNANLQIVKATTNSAFTAANTVSLGLANVQLRRVSTIAELKLLTPQANMTVQVDGYYSKGDGGGGKFYGHIGTVTDNGGTIITSNVTGGTASSGWKRIQDDPLEGINVKWFGAKGDRVTDDTDAIRRAATAALYTTYLITFPWVGYGTYKVTDTIVLPGLVGLRGQIGFPTSNALVHLLQTTTIEYFGNNWCMTASSPPFIENIRFMANGTSSYAQSGLKLKAGTFTKVKNVIIQEFDEIGFQLGDAADGFGNGCYFCDFDGMRISTIGRTARMGFVLDGMNIQNNNSNTFRNIHVAGLYNYLFDVRGQANMFEACDCEPKDSSAFPGWHKSWYRITGTCNKFMNPYIEPYVITYANTKMITFEDQHAGISFRGLPNVGDTITLSAVTRTSPAQTNTKVITFLASGATSPNCNIGATVQETVNNLAELIQSNTTDMVMSRFNAEDLVYSVLITPRIPRDPYIGISESGANVVCSPNMAGHGSTGNEFLGTYLIGLPQANPYAAIDDKGVRNKVDIVQNSHFTPPTAGLTGYVGQNLVYNSNFRAVDYKNPSLPKGWWTVAVVGATPNCVLDQTVTYQGDPTIKMNCYVGDSQTLMYHLFSANATQAPYQSYNPDIFNANNMAGKTITVGIWCKSDTAGFGTVRLFDGYSNYGPVSHTGSNEWEFLSTSVRIGSNQPINPMTQVSIRLQNRVTDNFAETVGGTCYFAHPCVVFGREFPLEWSPKLLNESEAKMGGRLTLNDPMIISGTNPSVQYGNFYKVLNSSANSMAGFANGKPGQEITLLFLDANTTITTSANIISQNSSARGANTVAKFISDGNTWYEIAKF